MDEKKSKKLNIKVDLRLVCIVLLIVIGAMLAIWKPWQDTVGDNMRKITVSGKGVIKAGPDQFVFNPFYEKDTTSEATALNEKLIKDLKDLGVKDSDIKNNASRYGSPEIYYTVPVDGSEKTTLSLTITLDNKELSQKVQDYLLTTNPKGSITPQPSFSTAKQKELEDKARTEAVADARKRADTTANGLGTKIGKVLEISEGNSGGVYPISMMGGAAMSADGSVEKQSLAIQPGQDEFSYTVSVTFALK